MLQFKEQKINSKGQLLFSFLCVDEAKKLEQFKIFWLIKGQLNEFNCMNIYVFYIKTVNLGPNISDRSVFWRIALLRTLTASY